MNRVPADDPRELILRAKSGDAEAFGGLYRLFFDPVFKYLTLRVRNGEDVRDLLQDVFLKVHQGLPRYKDSGKPPLAYFFTVARNVVIDHWRKSGRMLAADPETLEALPGGDESPESRMDAGLAADSVREAMEILTAEQQEVITLKFMNELSNKEIAAMLGKTEEAVRQIQCRGLRALRRSLKYEKQS